MSTSTSRTLSMKFDTDSGTTSTVSVAHCKNDLSVATVREAMDVMIANPIFVHALTDKVGAKITERTVTTLF